jgi:hypothetical protein
MGDSKTGSTDDIGPASADGTNDDRVAVPPAPIVPTSVALPSLIAGNLMFVLLLIALARDLLPNWLVLVLGVAVTAIGASIEGRNSERLRNDFSDQRFAEIRPYFADEESARAQTGEDLKSSLDLQPMHGVIAIPAFLATFLVPVLIFVEVDQAQSDLFWLLRWVLALGLATVFWFVFGAIWAFANMTPAATHMDFASLRGETAEIQALGPEDQNDIHIIREMANLQSLHRRIDTYTLESALLSALSFSSFLSIAVSERDYDAQLGSLFSPEMVRFELENMTLPLVGTVDHFIHPSAQYVDGHIVAWIALSLLLCATTFLGVLVARLRFNDGYRDAESALKAAERLNERQDLAIERDLPDKVAAYSQAIDELLKQAVELQAGLSYTVMHMRWSRDAGILFFVVTLVLCGLFFNGWVAGLIVAVFAVAVLFGSIDRQTRGQLRARVFGRGGLLGLLGPLKGKKPRA